MHPQLTLQFEQQNAQSFSSFFTGSNSVLVDSLLGISQKSSDDRQLMMWGPVGSGKSHLLAASCDAASKLSYRIAYLPASLLANSGAIAGLEEFDLVCVDDLHELPSCADSELAVFELINSLRNNGGSLLLGSDLPLASLAIALPDLRTRLAWGAVFSVQALDSVQVLEALTQQAHAAGLAVGPEVFDYLLNHYPRDIASQSARLSELDQACMQSHRRLTIPFIREVLNTQPLNQGPS